MKVANRKQSRHPNISTPSALRISMDANKPRTSSFSRNLPAAAAVTSQAPGLKPGPNGTTFLSSGIPDLDKILGGGFSLGSLVLVMEDLDAPHHMLLLRNFMSQGLIHDQPLLFASPATDPRGFLGTLPRPVSLNVDKSHHRDTEQEKALRIAWQYKKYFEKQSVDGRKDKEAEYCCEFDLRKPLERATLIKQHITCVSLQKSPDLATFTDHCSTFLAQIPRCDGNLTSAGRIALLSFCAPYCEFSSKEWDVLAFIRSLRSMVSSSNAVAVITFPPSLVSPTMLKRWQHLADTLISLKAIPDEDKELAQLLTGYQDMLGLLSVHKVARLNTQVPATLEATTFSMKLHKRKSLILECLNQAPVDGSSGSSYGTSGSCSFSSKTGSLDF